MYPHKLLPEPWITSHPSSQQAILATMVHKARTLCDKENLHDMLEFLKTTLKENSYSLKQI